MMLLRLDLDFTSEINNFLFHDKGLILFIDTLAALAIIILFAPPECNGCISEDRLKSEVLK